MFKLEHDVDRKVERFKARLVAKGYAQKYGIDYDEIFSPVARFSSIRFLVAFAVQHDMLIHQMDVEAAFLNGKLHEEIYMRQPEVIYQTRTRNIWYMQAREATIWIKAVVPMETFVGKY